MDVDGLGDGAEDAFSALHGLVAAAGQPFQRHAEFICGQPQPGHHFAQQQVADVVAEGANGLRKPTGPLRLRYYCKLVCKRDAGAGRPSR